jgi:hypothetical protein
MAELLGWGAGGLQLLNQEKAQAAAQELDRIELGLKQAEAARAEKEAELDAEAAALISGIASGDKAGVTNLDAPEDPAELLDTIGNVYLRGGSVKRAIDSFTAAAGLRQKQASADSSRASARRAMFDVQIKQTDLVSRLTRTVNSEEDWHAAIDRMESSSLFLPEEIEQFRSVPFSPEVIAALQQEALSAGEQARLELQRDNAESLERYRNTTSGISRRLEARLNETRRRNAVLEKAGGDKPATAPTTNELEAARAAIIADVFGGEEPEADIQAFVDVSSQNIAARAKQIVQENRGIDFATAVNQAVIESESAGDWEVVKGLTIPFIGEVGGGVRGYKAKGKSPQDPIPVPPATEVHTLVKGRYYQLKNGEVARFDGTNFIVD